MSIYTTNNRLKQIMETTKGSSIGMGGITLLIVVLMMFFAVLPAYRSITDQAKNNEIKTKYLEELKKKKSVLDKLAISYQNNLSKIDYFNLYNNPVPNTETLVANIDLIARNNNCTLKGVEIAGGSNYQSPESSPFVNITSLRPQEMQLVFTGKMTDIPYLIKSLEEFPLTIYIYTMNIVQVTSAEDITIKAPLSTNDMVELTIKGEIYFWNQDQP